MLPAVKTFTRLLIGSGAVAFGALMACGAYAEAHRVPDQP